MLLGDRLYVSTVCLGHGLGYEEVLQAYQLLGIDGVELGFIGDYEGDLNPVIDRFDFEYLCHNYCLPAEARILNLASADDELRTWSENYVRRAIDFCASHSIELYTVHGGFRVDPTLELTFEGEPVPYEAAFERFLTSIERLAAVANRHGVGLGIENNVVETNHLNDGENDRLLFVRSEEFERLFDQLQTPNVGLLLDLGHLNVASETIGFDPSEFETLADEIVAFHVHDNDGDSDDHRPISSEDWGIRTLLDSYSTVEAPVVLESHFEDVDSLTDSFRGLCNLS